jgi:SAM-dependent methyltransferase
MLPRLQLIELTDMPWLPTPLRDTVIESLGRTLDWGRMLAGMIDPFCHFVEASGAREVLDVCAGSGGPARVLAAQLASRGQQVKLVLSDLYPRLGEWRAIAAELGDGVSFIAESVDATAIPQELSRDRARMVVNAFHHFPPELAQAILADAVRSRAAIWISEPFERQPLRFLSFFPAGTAALLATPWLSRERRFEKAALTYLTPLPWAVSLFDGFVSTMRVYSECELLDMVAPLGDGYAWKYGTYDFAPLGRGYYFYGTPRATTRPASE